MTTRRDFLVSTVPMLLKAVPETALIQPAELQKILQEGHSIPKIICVGFPVLYRQKHIPDAVFAGPTSKPEGISTLQKAVRQTAQRDPIVIYCGCCPMVRCPNIQPAFDVLAKLGCKNVRVLNLPTNFHTDWVGKGYPVETKP